MKRLGLMALMATTGTACMGLGAGVIRGDLNTAAQLSFEAGSTDAEASLLAFDPAQHRMEIVISIEPLETSDMDVVIVTDSGTRFQVLGSFHQCTDDGVRRRCERELPVLPSEQVGSWRVEAERDDASVESSVQVEVNWVPLG